MEVGDCCHSAEILDEGRGSRRKGAAPAHRNERREQVEVGGGDAEGGRQRRAERGADERAAVEHAHQRREQRRLHALRRWMLSHAGHLRPRGFSCASSSAATPTLPAPSAAAAGRCAW